MLRVCTFLLLLTAVSVARSPLPALHVVDAIFVTRGSEVAMPPCDS
jgi:hypothetical protein